MPLPMFAAPLIGAGSSALLNEIFGGPSGAEKEAQRLSNESAGIQNQNLRQAQEHQETLKRISRLPSAMTAILERTGGQGLQGPTGFTTSDEGGFSLTPTGGTDPARAFGAINFNDLRKRDDLHRILGLLPQDTGLIAQNSNQAFNSGLQRSGAMGSLAQNITEAILMQQMNRNQGGSSPSAFGLDSALGSNRRDDGSLGLFRR